MTSNAPESRAFDFRETAIDTVGRNLKLWLFNRLTAGSLGLFLRGGDIISAPPQIFGVYEPKIVELIGYLADQGYGDFLIDVGANLGLIACQSGPRFQEVHMFEPNPLLCNVLKTNAALALEPSRTFIYDHALGDSSGTATLRVPKHNWGGAFVNDGANAYRESLLAEKDGFSEFDDSNYIDLQISIRPTAEALPELFRSLHARGLTQGVIKIDVEGYEATIIKGIAAALPKNFKVCIIFECLEKDWPIGDIVDAFGGRAKVASLRTATPWRRHWPNWLKLMSLAVRPKFSTTLEQTEGIESRDMVLFIQ